MIAGTLLDELLELWTCLTTFVSHFNEAVLAVTVHMIHNLKGQKTTRFCVI